MRLSDCFVETIAYTQLFLQERRTDYASFRARVVELLEEGRQRARQGGVAAEDFNAALYAIIAWVDEIVLCSDWEGVPQWQRDMLQKQYFGTSRAGVDFYAKLDGFTSLQRPIREVYYICLMLGFKGRYGQKRDQTELERLKQQNLDMLMEGRESALQEGGLLFPQAYSETRQTRTVLRRSWMPSLSTLAVIGAPVLILIALYLTYDFILGNMVANFSRFLR